MQDNKERHLELSLKFLEMGQALVKEGVLKKDNPIIQSGNVFILLGGMIVNEVDMYEFIDYCSKFSSKKLLDGLEASGTDVYDYIQTQNDISVEDFIRKIKGENPTDEETEEPSDE